MENEKTRDVILQNAKVKKVKCEICGKSWDTISPCAACNATANVYRQ